ncbi:hypothetical protein JXJ21_12075 [candidate division KSB1 bacterium]|nr:hypothetical protein [candidate division KSB1 bacterium]
MAIEDLRTEVLEILRQKDITGKELIKTYVAEKKDAIKALGFEKYDVDNPASMGNFIAKEIMPHLGEPVYKEKINVRGSKRTLYSLTPGESRVKVE